MKVVTLSVALIATGLASTAPAQAKGCIKGALVGGAAGHYAGHGVLGAAAGCIAGRSLAHRRAARDRDQVAPVRGTSNVSHSY
jgi:hypothetical protein